MTCEICISFEHSNPYRMLHTICNMYIISQLYGFHLSIVENNDIEDSLYRFQKIPFKQKHELQDFRIFNKYISTQKIRLYKRVIFSIDEAFYFDLKRGRQYYKYQKQFFDSCISIDIVLTSKYEKMYLEYNKHFLNCYTVFIFDRIYVDFSQFARRSQCIVLYKYEETKKQLQARYHDFKYFDISSVSDYCFYMSIFGRKKHFYNNVLQESFDLRCHGNKNNDIIVFDKPIEIVTESPHTAVYYSFLKNCKCEDNMKIHVFDDYFLPKTYIDEFIAFLTIHRGRNFILRHAVTYDIVCKIETKISEISEYDDFTDTFPFFIPFRKNELVCPTFLYQHITNRFHKYENGGSVLNEYFDAVFIIHVPSQYPRIRNIMLLGDTNTDFYVVDAIRASESKEIQLFCDTINYRNTILPALRYKNTYNSVNYGSTCLNLSNQLIFEFSKSNHLDKILILEDDILIHREIESKLKKAFTTLPTPMWDILYFGKKQMHPQLNKDKDWYAPNQFTWGTHAYAIRCDYIPLLQNQYQTFYAPIDILLQDIRDQGRVLVYKEDLFITELESLTSLIQETQETYTLWNWNIQSYRTVFKKPCIPFHGSHETFNNGWDKIVDVLLRLFPPKQTSQVPLFFDFGDRHFGWDYWKLTRSDFYPFCKMRNRPMHRKWYGIFHHPYQLPSYWDKNIAISDYSNNSIFKECLPQCQGIVVLSNYIKHQLDNDPLFKQIPVHVIYHPIIHRPMQHFIYEKYRENSRKKIINVGWSFRKLWSIYRLQVPREYEKILLLNGYDVGRQMDKEKQLWSDHDDVVMDEMLRSVHVYDRLELDEYYELLTENIVFLDFIEASANNAIMECIATHTPVIVSRHPAVIEYLGEDYPLYFDTLEDVPRLLDNLSAIQYASYYLSIRDRLPEFTMLHFFQQLYSII